MTDKRQDRGDGRDNLGRWINRSGNPSGRPRKIPDLDMADICNFSTKLITIKIGGEEQTVTHHEALVHALFQTAMKGRITAQRYLLDKFEEAEMSEGYVRMRYHEYAEALINDPDSVPENVKRLMPIIEASFRPQSKIRKTSPKKKNRNE